jgi:hypothetical protein
MTDRLHINDQTQLEEIWQIAHSSHKTLLQKYGRLHIAEISLFLFPGLPIQVSIIQFVELFTIVGTRSRKFILSSLSVASKDNITGLKQWLRFSVSH